MEKYLSIAVALVAFLGVVIIAARTGRAHKPVSGIGNWLCYYGMTAGPEAFRPFDLIVFDGHYHPALPEKKDGRPLVLGYASVGEVVNEGHLWGRVKGQPYLTGKNQFWDSWRVDITHPDWQGLLLETVLPAIEERGFDGFFLDNLDAALGLPDSMGSPDFDQKKTALVKLVGRIRTGFPKRLIAVNRGMPILPDLAPLIDFVVVEGLYSTYVPSEKQYQPVDAYARNLLLQQVQQGLRANPSLKILTVDYADPGQSDLISGAITFSRSRGFIPYVSTYKLDKVYGHALDH